MVQLCAGLHTCARLDTGDVRCWGATAALGYGNLDTVGDDETPASAGNVDVGGPVEQIECGTADTTCALLTTGALRCWGKSVGAELGYGNRQDIGDDETPASAGDIELGGVATHVAAGVFQTCAVLSGGGVRCWGAAVVNGHPTAIGDDETPASAGDVDVGGAVTQLAAGFYHTCALLTTGSVRCWGFGGYGVLGYGNTLDIGDDETPASAGDVDVGGVVTQIVAGTYHTCALLTSGDVRCWGTGLDNKLGYGNTQPIGDNETPASAGSVNVGGAVAQIAAGSEHTCALLTTGAVRCWGSGSYGQLGYANTLSVLGAPASAGVVDLGGPVVQLTAGLSHTCALLESGDVRCWGVGSNGRLGYGNTEWIGDDETPASAGSVQVL